jgi:Fe-S-cluster containining protein
MVSPVIDCSGCGACCSTQGTPPGYAAFFPLSSEAGDWGLTPADNDHYRNAPQEAKDILRAYFDARHRDEVGDRYNESLPCLWYDEQTKGCRFYEHRPQVCREFEIGSHSCLGWRASVGLGPDPGPEPETSEQ